MIRQDVVLVVEASNDHSPTLRAICFLPGRTTFSTFAKLRAVLATPPLSDTWTKTAKLLNGYAKAVGDEMPDGDELAALEFKEDVLDHMRFLDMAVYNNVFNPIRTEGESGATKELIRSYYEDPVSEYKACVRALDGLIELAK